MWGSAALNWPFNWWIGGLVMLWCVLENTEHHRRHRRQRLGDDNIVTPDRSRIQAKKRRGAWSTCTHLIGVKYSNPCSYSELGLLYSVCRSTKLSASSNFKLQPDLVHNKLAPPTPNLHPTDLVHSPSWALFHQTSPSP